MLKGMQKSVKCSETELLACISNLLCRLDSASDLRVMSCSEELSSLFGETPEYFTDVLNKEGTREFFANYKPNGVFSVKCLLLIDCKSRALPVTLLCKDDGVSILCLVTKQMEWFNDVMSSRRISDHYNRLLENTDTYLFETDMDWNLVCCTAKLLEMFSELEIGDSLKSYLSTGNRTDPKCQKALNRLLDVSDVFCFDNLEKIRIQVGEKYVWFQIHITSIVNPNTNEINGIAGSLTDIDAYEIASTELNARLQKDDMTGCFLKSYMLSSRVWSTITENAYCLFFDLDNFKQINDSFGHLMGDAALVKTAALARKLFAAMPGLVCRFGGDEFCIFLPKVTRKGITEAVGRLLTEAKRIDIDGKFPISLSVGVAAYDSSLHSNMQDLIDDADDLLYKAKRNGRDQMVCSWWEE